MKCPGSPLVRATVWWISCAMVLLLGGCGEDDPTAPDPEEIDVAAGGLTSAWTVNVGNAAALATYDGDGDGSEEIFVSDVSGTMHVFAATGTLVRTFPFQGDPFLIEIGTDGLAGPQVVNYRTWGPEITVSYTLGNLRWLYGTSSAVNGARWGDIDGDGTDELVVGYNGSGGLHMLDSTGQLIWSVSTFGNVWSQAIIPANSPGGPLVLATEAGGNVQVFDGAGNHMRTLNPINEYHATMDATVTGPGGGIQIIASSQVASDLDVAGVVAFDEMGTVAWTDRLLSMSAANRARPTVFSRGDLNGDGFVEWVYHNDSGTLVVREVGGTQLAQLADQSTIDAHAIATATGAGLLLTLESGVLTAYSFTP